MAIKKIYSGYKKSKLQEVSWLQKQIDDLNYFDDNHYLAQRDAFNQQQKEKQISKSENYKKYLEEYNKLVTEPADLKNSQILLKHYYLQYNISEISGDGHLSASAIYDKDFNLSLLNPKNIKLSEEPIPIMDLEYFKQDAKRKIQELENKIEIIKTETSNVDALSKHEPFLLKDRRWLYQDEVYEIKGNHSKEEQILLILEFADKERRKFERLKNKFSTNRVDEIEYKRVNIPENVRIEVWRRDQGKCAKCGSRENLEYDHIVPVSKGGSNSARNIELLCQNCNRAKSNNIG